MFPNGNRGWNINIRLFDLDAMEIDPQVNENGQPIVVFKYLINIR